MQTFDRFKVSKSGEHWHVRYDVDGQEYDAGFFQSKENAHGYVDYLKAQQVQQQTPKEIEEAA